MDLSSGKTKRQTEEEKRIAEKRRVDAFMAQRLAANRSSKPAAKPTAQQVAMQRNEERISKYGPSGLTLLIKTLGLK